VSSSDLHFFSERPSLSIVTGFLGAPFEGVWGEVRKDPFEHIPFNSLAFEKDFIVDLPILISNEC
jgi:hypothetical protein